jgi:hypothetical protein
MQIFYYFQDPLGRLLLILPVANKGVVDSAGNAKLVCESLFTMLLRYRKRFSIYFFKSDDLLITFPTISPNVFLGYTYNDDSREKAARQ